MAEKTEQVDHKCKIGTKAIFRSWLQEEGWQCTLTQIHDIGDIKVMKAVSGCHNDVEHPELNSMLCSTCQCQQSPKCFCDMGHDWTMVLLLLLSWVFASPCSSFEIHFSLSWTQHMMGTTVAHFDNHCNRSWLQLWTEWWAMHKCLSTQTTLLLWTLPMQCIMMFLRHVESNHDWKDAWGACSIACHFSCCLHLGWLSFSNCLQFVSSQLDCFPMHWEHWCLGTHSLSNNVASFHCSVCQLALLRLCCWSVNTVVITLLWIAKSKC